MKDYVFCHHCGFKGLIELGGEFYPKCKKRGFLSWVDEDNQEVSDDFIVEKDLSS